MSADFTLEEIALRYAFICNSTKADIQSGQQKQVSKHLQALNVLLADDLRTLARKGSPDNFADIYFEMQQELERLHEFCSFPSLAEKVVVAFGGSFSAGKSSLINALLGKRLLVTEVDPTTLLPTYLMAGNQDAVHALNLFGHCITLSHEDFLSLTHDEVQRYGSNVSRLLRSAFITRADFPWSNLALIDTPGYTKDEEGEQCTRTDEHIARIQLNSAQAIVWLIDARQGGITENDLRFLGTLQCKTPPLIVVSRADQKSDNDMKTIVSGIKETLAERNFPIVDVVPFSTRSKQQWPISPIREHLSHWNEKSRTVQFAHNFKDQFASFSQYLEDTRHQAQRQLNSLVRILTIEDAPEAHVEAEKLKQSVANTLNVVKIQLNELERIRHQFFRNLETIGEIIGIPLQLPEPSGWELLLAEIKNAKNENDYSMDESEFILSKSPKQSSEISKKIELVEMKLEIMSLRSRLNGE